MIPCSENNHSIVAGKHPDITLTEKEDHLQVIYQEDIIEDAPLYFTSLDDDGSRGTIRPDEHGKVLYQPQPDHGYSFYENRTAYGP